MPLVYITDDYESGFDFEVVSKDDFESRPWVQRDARIVHARTIRRWEKIKAAYCDFQSELGDRQSGVWRDSHPPAPPVKPNPIKKVDQTVYPRKIKKALEQARAQQHIVNALFNGERP